MKNTKGRLNRRLGVMDKVRSTTALAPAATVPTSSIPMKVLWRAAPMATWQWSHPRNPPSPARKRRSCPGPGAIMPDRGSPRTRTSGGSGEALPEQRGTQRRSRLSTVTSSRASKFANSPSAGKTKKAFTGSKQGWSPGAVSRAMISGSRVCSDVGRVAKELPRERARVGPDSGGGTHARDRVG